MKRWIKRFKKIKNKDFFGKVSQILNAYVLILGIIAVLVSIGMFSLSNEPEIKIIKAGYTFQMNGILEISRKEDYKKMLQLSSDFAALYVDGVDANAPIGSYLPEMKKQSMKDMLSYTRVGSKLRHGWSENRDEDAFYRLGVVDTIPKYWMGRLGDASRNRTDLQKIFGIRLLLTEQTLNELDPYSAADKTKQGFGIHDFKFDPIKELYKLRTAVADSVTYMNLVRDFSFTTKVFSVLSIANPSEENMLDIDLFINQIYNYGNLNIIGWTNLSSVDLYESDSPNIHVKIEQINPGQSIELVFYGMTMLREQDIKLSYPRFASIDKAYVVILMSVIALLVVVLFLIFGKE